MKKKKNYILWLNDLVKVVWILILLGACQSEDQYQMQQEKPVPVRLNVSSFGTPPSSGIAGESDAQITSIYILQFNANNDAYGTLRYVAQGVPATNGKYTVDLLQSMGTDDNYKLVVLANLTHYGFLYGLYGKTYKEVQQACLSQATPDPLVFDVFPMFGVVNGGASVQVQEGTVYTSNTELIRAVARVDIGIGTKKTNPDGSTTSWIKGNVPFTMTEIQIWQAGQKYTYMPAVENYHWTTTADGTASKKIVIDRPSEAPGAPITKTYNGTSYITDSTYCLGKIYLPEADLQWGNVYDNQHTSRLAIIVGGYYNNSPNLSYYRVDFTNDNSGDKMNILRNHIYQFSITKVADTGYATAELAYNSVPRNISFTANLTAWTSTNPVSIPSIIGYRISYGKLNGENLLWDATTGLNIPPKKNSWPGYNKYSIFDYNEFYGEANLFYSLKFPIGIQNGQLYPTTQDTFNHEGPYPILMVSGDDIIDVNGHESVTWKTGTTLTAFDLCRNYQEKGYNDWRLPRLSELALIYLNRQNLESMRGFTPFIGTYWSGSEYLVSNSDKDRKHSEQAWGIDFGTANPDNAANHAKTELLKIRCVRQVQ